MKDETLFVKQSWCAALGLAFLMIGTCALAQMPAPSACEKLKEGKFQIEDKESGVSIITRKAGIQREENEELGIVVEYLTEWIDPCTYRLVPFKVIRNDNKLDMDGDLKLIIEIIEIKEDSYTQITTSFVTKKNETEIVKIIK
jgi:hypothetical protein